MKEKLETILGQGFKYQLTYGNFRGRSSYDIYAKEDKRIMYDPEHDRVVHTYVFKEKENKDGI